MRVTRVAQASIFEVYSEHEFGVQLKALSDILDQHPDILTLVAADLIDNTVSDTEGLGVKSIYNNIYLIGARSIVNEEIDVCGRI